MSTTEKAGYTPGPWHVGPYYRHEVVSEHGVICCAPIETEQTRANARLISAAPELLEALKNTTRTLRLMMAATTFLTYPPDARKEVREEIAFAEAAVRKAEGQS